MTTDPSSISLREYFERLLAEHDRAVALQFANAHTALDKSERLLDDRLHGMNEFRDQLREQAAQFVTNKELTARLDTLDARLKSLEQSRAHLEGRFWAIGAAMVVVNVVITIAGFVARR